MKAALKGPAFVDGGEAFKQGKRLASIPSFYADGDYNQYSWELGWRVAERLAAPTMKHRKPR